MKASLNKKFGGYILLDRLAIGGMAEIFLSLKLGGGSLEKLLVLKRILPQYRENRDFVKLFYREASLSCLLQHPNLVQCWDADKIEGQDCMVMEYMRGVTLEEMQFRAASMGVGLELDVCIWLCINACEALHYLHVLQDNSGKALKIVHRDVSPQNIFVCYDGVCKLFDFGVAQLGSVEDLKPGMLTGKYAYMSPEQLRGERLSASSDVFSMGCVLYELTTGCKAFERENDIRTLDAVKKGEYILPSAINEHYPSFLEHIVRKCLESEPGRRYGSALELSEDLRKFLKISGLKPTDHSVSDVLKRLFKNEIGVMEEFISQAVSSAESKFGRPDPLKGLVEFSNSSSDLAVVSDDELYEPEGVGVESFDRHLVKGQVQLPPSMVSIGMEGQDIVSGVFPHPEVLSESNPGKLESRDKFVKGLLLTIIVFLVIVIIVLLVV